MTETTAGARGATSTPVIARDPFVQFAGLSAMLVGLLSILYALFFLLITRTAPYTGALGSWLILGISGLFASAAYIALYGQLRDASAGFALWGLVLGSVASLATLVHGIYQVLVLAGNLPATGLPSQVDPSGLATFFVTGLVSLVFSALIVRSHGWSPALGYLGMVNALLLVVLFLATATGVEPLVLLSGGLTAVIVGPIWWIGVGRALLRAGPARVPELETTGQALPSEQELNKAVARRFMLEGLGEGKLGVVDQVLAPDYLEHAAPPGIPPTREGVKRFILTVRNAFPDLHYTVDDAMSSGDQVVLRLTGAGTMREAFLNAAPSGKHASWSEIHVYRLRDEKIVEHWADVDELSMLQQLGLIPAGIGGEAPKTG